MWEIGPNPMYFECEKNERRRKPLQILSLSLYGKIIILLRDEHFWVLSNNEMRRRRITITTTKCFKCASNEKANWIFKM